MFTPTKFFGGAMRGRFLLLLAAPAAILAQEIVPRADSPTDVVPRHLSEVSYLGASECSRRRRRPDLTTMESDALYLTHKSDAPVRNESGQAVYASKI